MLPAFSLPDPEIVRRTAREVVQRPEYQLDPPTDREWKLFRWLFEVVRWILKPFAWLFQAMEGIPDVLRWAIVVGLALVLAALIAHIIYTFVVVFRGPRRADSYDPGSGRIVTDPAVLERRAEEAATRGDYVAAIRLLFGACLLRLEQIEQRRFRPGMTNREHVRRLRATPLFDPIDLFVRTIDVKWYGGRACGLGDYEDCRRAHASVVRLLKETAHVVSA